MAPDVIGKNTSTAMEYNKIDDDDNDNNRPASNYGSGSDWESSYSEVEISIESDQAEDENSSSSSTLVEEITESSYEDIIAAEYEELVEDPQEGSGDFAVAVPEAVAKATQPPPSPQMTEDLFARSDAPNNILYNQQQQQQQRQQSFSSRNDNSLRSPSQKGRSTVDEPGFASPNRRAKGPANSSSAKQKNDARTNHGAFRNHNGNHREQANAIQTAATEAMTPADSEHSNLYQSDSKPNSDRSLQRKPTSSSNLSATSNSNSNSEYDHQVRTSNKSFKIPALHNNKQEGDEDYIQRKLEQEYNRRSRSLSRSDKSGSPGRNQSHSNGHSGNRHRNRTSRSRSNSKHSRQRGKESNQNQNRGEESPTHDNSNSGHNNAHPQRTVAASPSPRRTSSTHTSTPSNQLAASNNNSRSNHAKHSNYDGSKRVSWKSDPKASFSDWTLHVLYRDSNNKRRIDVYHVHRNVVGFGHRKSNFLLRDIMKTELNEFVDFDSNSKTEVELQELINSGNRTNKSNSKRHNKDPLVTRLKLPSESQARSVPMVLDFMYYTNETKQRMSADRSCNVFKVAEGLEVQALQKAIGEFYMKNLSLKNLGEFLAAATTVKADKLLTICKAKIGQMITVKPELSAMVPPKFMAEILYISSKQLNEARRKEPHKYTGDLVISQSKYWSKAACICASENESVMTQTIFQKLTSEESLPYIDVSATPTLLAIEATFLKHKSKKLTSLQRRCVESIGEDFDAFQECFDSHEEIAESLKHLPSHILSEILMKLLTR